MSYYLEQDKRELKKTYIRLSKSYDAFVEYTQELELLKTIKDEFWKIRIDFLEIECKKYRDSHLASLHSFYYCKERLRTKSERQRIINERIVGQQNITPKRTL